ncbi:MAG: hypothetical protein HYV07_03095 [Deltaproteobacteria bacterium]|nr:hypothetical protein [Deltaproteobacteria bacterium]
MHHGARRAERVELVIDGVELVIDGDDAIDRDRGLFSGTDVAALQRMGTGAAWP